MEPDPGVDPERFVRVGLLFYGLIAIAAVVWRVGFYGEELWQTSPPHPSPMSETAALGLGVACGLATVAFSYILTEWTGWGRELATALAQSIGPVTVPNAVLLALASGFAEEALFRGALQPRAGLVLASLLFGAAHFVPRRELLPWSVFAVVMGFAFGALFNATGTLTAPVAAHTVINAINLPLLVRRYGDFPKAESASFGERSDD